MKDIKPWFPNAVPVALGLIHRSENNPKPCDGMVIAVVPRDAAGVYLVGGASEGDWAQCARCFCWLRLGEEGWEDIGEEAI